jgi:hypothetical protein
LEASLRLLRLIGFISFLWFLVRVITKPSRAGYPCMRVAFPLASGFIVWLVGLASTAVLVQRSQKLWRRSRFAAAAACCLAAVIAAWFSVSGGLTHLQINGLQSVLRAEVSPDPANAPIGTAKGANPGRVVWVHDPDATDWEGPVPDSGEWCWEPDHTNQMIVDGMMSKAIRWLAGQPTEAEAWNALFRHTNLHKGVGDRGYQAGEKIVIKINLVLCLAGSSENPSTRELNQLEENAAQTNPQQVLALLRQLVYVAGVDSSDISVGDTVTFFPQQWYEYFSGEFPDINYLDHYPFTNRTQVEFSDTPFYWSTSDAVGKVPDYLPQSFVGADYLINFAVLKSHAMAGITLCAKNHYGSLIRSPNGRLWGQEYDYYALHTNLPYQLPGRIQYRNLVDLMGHSQIGGKTLLYLIDALYGGKGWDGAPFRWNTAPFSGDWPSSLFASQDPVAIDSVGYDFLVAEWSSEVSIGDSGAQDYLHEAAMAGNPPSGTTYDPENDGTPMLSLGVHEHWNNASEKQYSRNLGTGPGIELVTSDPLACLCDLNGDGDVDGSDIAAYIDTADISLKKFAADYGRTNCRL